MRNSCIVCLWIFLTEIRSSSTDGIEAHGYSGQHVTISCQHSWAASNKKYFCRDPCEDKLVSSDHPSNGKFSLKDLGNGEFTVTIALLQESDSGIYWCGVDRFGADTYKKVTLGVTKEIIAITELDTRPLSTSTQQSETSFATTTKVSRSLNPDDVTVSSSATASVNISLYFVGGSIAVIILVCVLVAACQYRKMVKKTEVTPVNHIDGKAEEATNVYENNDEDIHNSERKKSKKLSSKVHKSCSYSIYENEELKPGQSDAIYGNT